MARWLSKKVTKRKWGQILTKQMGCWLLVSHLYLYTTRRRPPKLIFISCTKSPKFENNSQSLDIRAKRLLWLFPLEIWVSVEKRNNFSWDAIKVLSCRDSHSHPQQKFHFSSLPLNLSYSDWWPNHAQDVQRLLPSWE